ncbi:MAG: MlaD family protein [Proteobacteria bacterium]|nr:MlaD family protein [Pseudomonadota bacterium]
MKRIYNNYFLVGLFTIIIGGISIVLLLNMGGRNDDTDRYYSYFANVTGLGYGNPVYYEGYRVGQVEKITPETIKGELYFKTEYTLIADWKVPTDSITKIASSGLLSDMSLNISAGTSKTYLTPNSEIQGVIGDDIMATLTQLAEDFQSLSQDKIIPLIDLVYARTDSLTKSLETQIPEILTAIEVLIQDINSLTKSANQLIGQENVEGINKIITNLEELTAQLSSTGGWIKTSLDKVNGLISSGDDLLKNNGDKVADLLDLTAQLISAFSSRADTIASEIESASMNINETTDIIRKNPKSLLFKNKSEIADEDL